MAKCLSKGETIVKILEKNYCRVFIFLLAALMIALVALQFIPFWECGCKECAKGDGMASIADYIWFPSTHKDLTNTMKQVYGKSYEIADIVLPPVIVIAAAICTFIFAIPNSKNGLTALIPLCGGLAAVIGYLTERAYQMHSSWTIGLVLGIVTVVFSLIAVSDPVIKTIKDQIEKNKAEK